MMQAGTYYVGDLCYVLRDQAWDDVLSLLFAGRTDHGCNQGEFNLPNGDRFAIFNTYWGDGSYRDQFGKQYPVDAGAIGCICVEDLPEGVDLSGGNVYKFDRDFHVSGGNDRQSWDGAIRIGHVMIQTNAEYEDEYEDEDE
jgi:hypothetical protein